MCIVAQTMTLPLPLLQALNASQFTEHRMENSGACIILYYALESLGEINETMCSKMQETTTNRAVLRMVGAGWWAMNYIYQICSVLKMRSNFIPV